MGIFTWSPIETDPQILVAGGVARNDAHELVVGGLDSVGASMLPCCYSFLNGLRLEGC